MTDDPDHAHRLEYIRERAAALADLTREAGKAFPDPGGYTVGDEAEEAAMRAHLGSMAAICHGHAVDTLEIVEDGDLRLAEMSLAVLEGHMLALLQDTVDERKLRARIAPNKRGRKRQNDRDRGLAEEVTRLRLADSRLTKVEAAAMAIADNPSLGPPASERALLQRIFNVTKAI